MKATADGASKAVGCKATEVYLVSTGVIGQILPAEKIVAQMSKLKAGLKADAWMTAAKVT